MKKHKFTIWVIASYICLAIAVVSALGSIVTYTNHEGITRSFYLVDFFRLDGNGFDRFALEEYIGIVYWDLNSSVIHNYIWLPIISFIFAFLGLFQLSQQKTNIASIVLSILGMIGTCIPSLVIVLCIWLLGKDFEGKISFGFYPIVAPLAMIVCIITATYTFRQNIRYKKKLKETGNLIFRGGDLY